MHDPIGEGAVGKFAQIEYIFDIYRISDPLGDQFGILSKYLGRAAADDAEAEYCYIYHGIRSF